MTTTEPKILKNIRFMYKEDFDKFSEGLDEVVNYIKAAIGGEIPTKSTEAPKSEFDVDFDQI